MELSLLEAVDPPERAVAHRGQQWIRSGRGPLRASVSLRTESFLLVNHHPALSSHARPFRCCRQRHSQSRPFEKPPIGASAGRRSVLLADSTFSQPQSSLVPAGPVPLPPRQPRLLPPPLRPPLPLLPPRPRHRHPPRLPPSPSHPGGRSRPSSAGRRSTTGCPWATSSPATTSTVASTRTRL